MYMLHSHEKHFVPTHYFFVPPKYLSFYQNKHSDLTLCFSVSFKFQFIPSKEKENINCEGCDKAFLEEWIFNLFSRVRIVKSLKIYAAAKERQTSSKIITYMTYMFKSTHKIGKFE